MFIYYDSEDHYHAQSLNFARTESDTLWENWWLICRLFHDIVSDAEINWYGVEWDGYVRNGELVSIRKEAVMALSGFIPEYTCREWVKPQESSECKCRALSLLQHHRGVIILRFTDYPATV
jgi:hypothetical protein